jgi:AraC-like DNA-binding protein
MLHAVVKSEAYTDDLDQGIAVTRAAFGEGVDIAPPERGGSAVAIRSFRTPQLQAIRWRMFGAGNGRLDQEHEGGAMVLAGLRVGGTLGLRTRDDAALDVGRPFLYPDFVDCQVDAPDLAALAVARERIDEHARAMTDDVRFRVRFTGTSPVTPAAERMWRSTMVYAEHTLAALVDEPEADIASLGLHDLVTRQLLRTFPNTALDTENERRRGFTTRNAAVRRALRFIEENLDRPFTTAELAAGSGLSLRGLHAAFQRELDTSPMRFVRDARLAAARDELLRARGSSVNVRAVALRWGFASPQQFARWYSRLYAEAFDETLLH